MKYLAALNKLECFSYEDALKIVKNENSTNSMLRYYKNNKSVVQIRKGLYSTVNPIDKEPLANKYLIGSKINSSAVISHFSAFEYYGYYNQVSYRVFVASERKFNKFKFAGYEYVRLPAAIKKGVVVFPSGARITDLERSVLDTINDYDKLLGFEELIKCIAAIPTIDERKLLLYLKEYDKKFLYQKVGFIFEHFKDEFDLSAEFFKTCAENFGSSSRYLLKEKRGEELTTDRKWRLTYPKNLWTNVEGGDLDVNI